MLMELWKLAFYVARTTDRLPKLDGEHDETFLKRFMARCRSLSEMTVEKRVWIKEQTYQTNLCYNILAKCPVHVNVTPSFPLFFFLENTDRTSNE